MEHGKIVGVRQKPATHHSSRFSAKEDNSEKKSGRKKPMRGEKSIFTLMGETVVERGTSIHVVPAKCC